MLDAATAEQAEQQPATSVAEAEDEKPEIEDDIKQLTDDEENVSSHSKHMLACN